MIILHIAEISNNMSSGVCVVVPQHVASQKNYAQVGFINVNKAEINNIDSELKFIRPFDIKLLKEPFNKPDLVVFHEIYVVEYLSISKNLNKNNIPYIIIPHCELSEGAQRKKRFKKTVANILLFNRFIKGAKAIQCLSQTELNSTHFNMNKFIGTNGINIPQKNKRNFNDEITKFVYIGRLDAYHKGLDLLIEAVGSEKEYLIKNKCEFYIYGPDAKGRYAHIKELIKVNGVENLVKLRGSVFGEEKEKILLDADIFIQTSRFEGMPMGILEALSYGIPCLITDGTTLGDFVRESNSGWVAETNIESIVKKIKQSLGEKTMWKEKSINAVKLIEDCFEWDAISKNTINEYKKYLGG